MNFLTSTHSKKWIFSQAQIVRSLMHNLQHTSRLHSFGWAARAHLLKSCVVYMRNEGKFIWHRSKQSTPSKRVIELLGWEFHAFRQEAWPYVHGHIYLSTVWDLQFGIITISRVFPVSFVSDQLVRTPLDVQIDVPSGNESGTIKINSKEWIGLYFSLRRNAALNMLVTSFSERPHLKMLRGRAKAFGFWTFRITNNDLSSVLSGSNTCPGARPCASHYLWCADSSADSTWFFFVKVHNLKWYSIDLRVSAKRSEKIRKRSLCL